MKKRFYLACAVLGLTALTASAQYVIETNTQITEPGAWTDMGTAESIAISGATVTFTKDAFNICGFPDGVPVTLLDGAKVVMFDSPDLWYPDIETAENEEYFDLLINAEGESQTHVPYEFIIDGEATIVADGKCSIGGKYKGSGTLTLAIGDSTVLAADFGSFTGKLIIEQRTPDVKLLIGTGFPGYDAGGLNYNTANTYGGMPWTLEIPDGLNITTYGTIAMALPQVVGKGHIEVGHTFIYRPAVSNTFECTVIGGGNRSFEYFSTGGVSSAFTEIIDYVGTYAYVRASNFGIFFNSDPATPTLANITGGVSMRNAGAFVGGTGYLGCSIDGKGGAATRIIPGAAEKTIGVLRAAKDIWFNDSNNLDVDFGADGRSDVLITDQAVRFNGANTRLTINLTEEFYANPKVGDYRLIAAQEYIGNITVDEEGVESINNKLTTLSPQLDELKKNTPEGEDAPTIDAILPAGYTWNFDNFFTEGIVSIIGEGYVPGVIVNDPTTGIEDGVIADKEVASRQYYSINGMLLNTPSQGFNIVRTQYTDGTVTVEKIFKN